MGYVIKIQRRMNDRIRDFYYRRSDDGVARLFESYGSFEDATIFDHKHEVKNELRRKNVIGGIVKLPEN